MQELLMLSGNPKRRRRHSKKARSHRRHRRMTPLQLQYFGGHRNPKRRHSSGKRRARRRGRSGFGRARGIVGKVFRTGSGNVAHPFSIVGPALTGAVGAALVNTVLGRLPLPAAAMQGNVQYVTRGAVAIGLGMLASRFGLGSAVASKMAEGSLTITLHDLIVQVSAQAGFPLSGMGYYLPGRQAIAPAASSAPARMAGMGRYVTGPGSPAGSVVPINRQARSFGNIASSFKF